jgi:hypothetical protein
MAKKKKKQRPLPQRKTERTLTPAEMEGIMERTRLAREAAGLPPEGGIDGSLREGVYVHSFICEMCGLHFNIYSWLANNHGVGTVGCPECGERKRMRHWRAIINESKQMTPRNEIFSLCPYPGALRMDDSYQY